MDAAGWDGTAATNTDLLLALKDQTNEQAWAALCARYRPVIISFARRLGLPEQDAQDAAQDSLFAFARAYRQGHYDRNRGRLRAWLFTIASRRIRDIQRKLCRRPDRGNGQVEDDGVEAIADDDRAGNPWEMHWQRAILDACLEEAARHVEPTTLAAFKLHVLEELPIDEVAERLNMSRNAAFKAQRRVLTRLREVYERITSDE